MAQAILGALEARQVLLRLILIIIFTGLCFHLTLDENRGSVCDTLNFYRIGGLLKANSTKHFGKTGTTLIRLCGIAARRTLREIAILH